MTIITGVLQGSVLGRILFLLYVNNIWYFSELVSVILFAYDTNVLHSNTCLKTLNEILQIEIKKITNWLNVNKLSFNTTKTKYILFRSRNKKSKHDLNISINEENIEQVKNITFLGIIIDEFLTWRDHIDLISKKIIKLSILKFLPIILWPTKIFTIITQEMLLCFTKNSIYRTNYDKHNLLTKEECVE